MPEGIHHLYVYYSVAPSSAAAATAAVAHVLAQVRAATGITGRIRRRADDPWLWMEIYEDIGDRAAFAEALDRVRAATALSSCLAPGKTFHTECFRDFDT